MAVTKTIRIKKRGGGTRLQRVEVLKSGKFKFVKNIAKRAKSAVKRVRKAAKVKRKRTQTRPMAKKRKFTKARGFASKLMSGPLKKVALGLGFGTLAATVVSFIAPQATPIIRPIAAFIGGGPIGLIADLFLSGNLQGLLGTFGLGGATANGPTESV